MSLLPIPEVLDQARAAGRVRLDLTVSDPSRCGLGWPAEQLADMIEAQRELPPAAAAVAARDAIASYLAGHGATVSPPNVLLLRSRGEALRYALAALCDPGGEALVPVPDLVAAGLGDAVRSRPYALRFDGRWRLDRRTVQRAAGPRTRAILAGNPSEPTGAALSAEELGWLAEVCSARGLCLVADESRLDSTLEPGRSVATAGCLAIHLSGLDGICGLPGLEVGWLAVAGPEPSARALAARLSGSVTVGPGAGVACVPPLLARREEFLGRLRSRLSRNRSALASSSLRESPWTLQWGGGWWAVLQINSLQDCESLSLSLLDDGVAVAPASHFGLPRQGYLVLSLLPSPEAFDAALERIESCLRRPA